MLVPGSKVPASVVLLLCLPFIFLVTALPDAPKHRTCSPREANGRSSCNHDDIKQENGETYLLGKKEKSGECVNGPETRGCWSRDFSVETNTNEEWPDTGNTVTYEFEISNKTIAPDGVEKELMLINGQFPGPTIMADWGDTIRVSVKNSLASNGTGIHWHGMRQLGSNHMDGVGGITECPIANGETRIYEFKATQYGTSWYHSHYSVQYADGIVGGIIIRGPSSANWDIDLGVLPFMDWFYDSIFTVNARTLHSTSAPTADNLLVNGSMMSTGDAGGRHSVTILQPGKKHLLRLVNMGVNNYVHVTLDAHHFEVIAADFVPIVPYKTNSLVIAVGQRYDVIIDADQEIHNYWLRVGTGGGVCDGPNANADNIRGIFHYQGSFGRPPKLDVEPLSTGCYDETNLVPIIKKIVPRDTPQNLTLGFTTTTAQDQLVQWLINGSLMSVDLTKPTLHNVRETKGGVAATDNLFLIDQRQWTYWVIQQDNNSPVSPIPHPIHLHGHDFFVLGWAENATWSGDISTLDFDNPIRRDTATLPYKGYIVLAFEADNPGAWLMHCHIPFHISAGLGFQFLERQESILDSLGDMSGLSEGCETWTVHQKKFFPDGFTPGDSVVKR